MTKVDAELLQERRFAIISLGGKGCQPARPQATMLAHATRYTPSAAAAHTATEAAANVATCEAVRGLLRRRGTRYGGLVTRWIELKILRTTSTGTSTVRGGTAALPVVIRHLAEGLVFVMRVYVCVCLSTRPQARWAEMRQKEDISYCLM